MKRQNVLCLTLLALLFLFSSAGAAAETAETDYAAAVQPDAAGQTLQAEASVYLYVDGDTTHFTIPGWPDNGILKARYIGCNTPESSGKIEEYGKAATRFTRERLQSAEKILIESDTATWNRDTTGSRYLVWVWYQPPGETAYRNLNIELLQNGLAIANSSAQNRYGDTCMAAIASARALKKNIYSGQPDPDFFYGDAIEVTLRELRLNPEEYEGKKVAFTAVITANHSNTVYLESYDPETEMYYGLPAYYGFNMSGGGLEVLRIGNEARIIGTMQYYEAGQAWQVSGMTYRMMKPDDPGNIRVISQGHEPAWTQIDSDAFVTEKVIETDEGAVTWDLAYLLLDTSVSFSGYAEVVDSDINGLYCLEMSDCGEEFIKVYTSALPDEEIGDHIITVHGFVHQFDGNYCIRVYNKDNITFLD